MHALGTDSKRYINSVIDQEWHSIFLADLVELSSSRNLISGVALFVTVLNHSDTWRYGLISRSAQGFTTVRKFS
jgi:hypothetical protein